MANYSLPQLGDSVKGASTTLRSAFEQKIYTKYKKKRRFFVKIIDLKDYLNPVVKHFNKELDCIVIT